MPLNVPVSKAKYVWAYGVDPNTGKGSIVGPFRDEESAREETREFDAVRCWELPTRDQNKASQLIRYKLKPNGLSYALRRKARLKPHERRETSAPAEGEDGQLFDEKDDTE